MDVESHRCHSIIDGLLEKIDPLGNTAEVRNNSWRMSVMTEHQVCSSLVD